MGVAIGAAVGKVVVRRRESRDGVELSARRVRQIEAAWIAILASIALTSSLIVELLLIMVGLIRTVLAGLVVVTILVGLSNVMNPEGLPYVLVFIVLCVLASFADRERFGWIEPRDGERERSVRR